MRPGRDDDRSIIARLTIDWEASKQLLASGQPHQKTTETGNEGSVPGIPPTTFVCSASPAKRLDGSSSDRRIVP